MSTTTDNITNTAEAVLAALVPALGPYGPAIALGISVLEKTAPAVYKEIVSLISQIQSGNDVSPDDLAKLQGLTAALRDPDKYFATPPVTASAPAAAAPTA